ncbi:hypothetical protein ACIQGZ_21830 [Streptomyces sp. NPDC092296]|uniref:hypothetical protein n=1 Tax=Streptomyces sp. NPDC092296 TaxID=3366012 RepID=UPI00380A722C
MTQTPDQPRGPAAAASIPTPTPAPAPSPSPAPGAAPGPGAAAAPALELLVHGVGGATPGSMLGDSHPVRILGDDTAGVYRRHRDLHAEDHPQDYRDTPLQEAYCWSGMTSGDATRALWLLLLPFMVVNLAHWMRPPGSAGRLCRTNTAYDLLLRLLALALTVLLAAGACEVAMDLFAWQCAGSPACAAHQSWLRFTATPHTWWHQPGRRLALGALPPVALVALLGLLSHRTWSAFEAHQPDDGPTAEPREAPMELTGFWYGKRAVGRLRIAHLAAALATVAAAVLLPTLRHDAGRAGSALLLGAGALLAALVAAVAVTVLVVLVRSVRREDILDDRPTGPAIRRLHWAALGVCLATLPYSGWSRPDWTTSGLLPGAALTFTVLAAAQLALVLGLAGAAALLARRPGRVTAEDRAAAAPPAAGTLSAPGFGGPDGPALRGLGGPVTAMLACGLGVLFTSGAVVWVADWLDRTTGSGEPRAARPGPPSLLSWHAVCLPVVLLAVAGLLLLVAARMTLQQHRLAGQVAAEYHVDPAEASPERSAAIAGALARARLTDSGPALIGAVALLALLGCTGSLIGSLLNHAAPAAAADGTPAVIAYVTDTAQALGSWLIGTVVVTLVALGRRAYKGAGARRTIGILWDIGTFWPRAAHPFAPPCYAERAVPDLVSRVRTWCGHDPARTVVVSAHSQGTVIAAAALWQLPEAVRLQVGLLSYGSPLRRLYGRFFPAFMGADDLERLRLHTPAWRNLYRHTDPIGGPVRIPSVDAPPLLDPLSYARTAANPLPTGIDAHSDYQADPTFAHERTLLLTHLNHPTTPARP